jgi:hypothetical protein
VAVPHQPTCHLFSLLRYPQGLTRASLAADGLQLLKDWGMLAVKSGVHGMKEVLRLTKELQRK